MIIKQKFKNQNVFKVNCPPKLSVNRTTERYIRCYTFWSLTCALITFILLCNCCDFRVNWKNCSMVRKQ